MRSLKLSMDNTCIAKLRRFNYITLALAVVLCFLPAACEKQLQDMGTTPKTPPKFESNRPPQLEPLYAEQKGRRVPVVYPGMTVTVKARATDPDGDIIRYRWIVFQSSGTVDSPTASSIVWKVGAGNGLMLVAYDGKGGQARERLSITDKRMVVFSGRVISNTGKPVDGAEVEVGDKTTQTDKQGSFSLQTKRNSSRRYVLNIRKSGFGLVSRVYDRGVQDGKWRMTKGTVVVADPTQPIVAQDASPRTGCLGPTSSRIDWDLYPEQRTPRFFDTSGHPINMSLPLELREAMEVLSAGTECSAGITVSIPANTLVNASGSLPDGRVEITVSTVDLLDPDSMPGDLSVDLGGEGGYMQSFGAGTVTAMADGKPLQLKKGARAEITIPVDPTQLKVKAPVKEAIPFLRYDEKNGVWLQVGDAKLDSKRNVYTAEVEHFSAFNTDLVKTDQSCVEIDSSQIGETFTLEVIIPMGDGTAPVVKTFTISPDMDPAHAENPHLHAIYNLPKERWIMMVAVKEPTPGTFVPLGTFVVNTGPAQYPTNPNRPEWDYFACQCEVALYEVLPKVTHVVDGTGRQKGPYPVHIYALAKQSDSTLYGGFYLFSLFDTGSTKVRLFNEMPYWFSGYPNPNQGLICNTPNRITDGNFFDMDTAFWGISSPVTVRVRLNGLNAVDPTSLEAPIGAPGSTASAQVEISGVEVQPQSGLDVTLIGAPVTHQVVAKIDYTSKIELSGYDFYPGLTDPGNSGISGFQKFDTVYGPDITFFSENDPTIPYDEFDLFLVLDRWGVPANRFCVRNVNFRKGTNSVDDAGLAGGKVLHYDTGAPITIINNDIASQLDLNSTSPSFDCFTPGDNLGYVIDEVTFMGPNGTYSVQNAEVCWDESKIQSSGVAAAVIGSNLFDKVPVLFDGPRNRLGIGQPTSTPVNWTVIPRNCD